MTQGARGDWFWKQNNLTYELQLNWPDWNTANLGQFLQDASIAWHPAEEGKFRVQAQFVF